MLQDEATAATQQDALRPFRLFLSGLNAAFYGDQAYPGVDGYAVNPSGQFSTVGPYGTSVEGQPLALTRNGGLQLSPSVVMLAIGAAAVLFWKRG